MRRKNTNQNGRDVIKEQTSTIQVLKMMSTIELELFFSILLVFCCCWNLSCEYIATNKQRAEISDKKKTTQLELLIKE